MPPDFCAAMTTASAVLAFRPLDAADQIVLRRQFQDPDMCVFHGAPFDDAFADDMIRNCRDVDPARGFVRVAIIDPASHMFLGTIGFHFYEAAMHRAEVGYDIWKEHWNRGYATEALRVLCAVLPTFLPIQTLYILTPQLHSASIAVAGHNDFAPCAPIRPGAAAATAWFSRTL